MYRDDLEATHARVEALQRELSDAQSAQATDKQRIAQLTAQLTSTQEALQRLGGAVRKGAAYVLPARDTTILVLGILSCVLCQVLGPIAWAMGNEELRRIDSGQVDPVSRGTTTAGRTCGIVGTLLLFVVGGFFVWMFATISAVSRY
jgi:hypothetical protein